MDIDPSRPYGLVFTGTREATPRAGSDVFIILPGSCAARGCSKGQGDFRERELKESPGRVVRHLLIAVGNFTRYLFRNARQSVSSGPWHKQSTREPRPRVAHLARDITARSPMQPSVQNCLVAVHSAVNPSRPVAHPSTYLRVCLRNRGFTRKSVDTLTAEFPDN